MKVDLYKIKELGRDARDLNAYIDDYLNNVCSPADPPFLSDIILGFNNGGVRLMEALADRYEKDRNIPQERRFRWKIQVLRDEWGNKPQPGDVVIRKITKKPQIEDGVPVTANALNYDIMTGEYEKKWVVQYPYEIDERGCITCEFEDAVHFLKCWGIHGKSGHNMSIHTTEHSGDPVKCPDGQMRHVWYWRYRESDKDDYAKIPIIQKTNDPKRGYKN